MSWEKGRVRLLAVSDVHGPRFLNLYLSSLRDVQGRDYKLLIFAGDMVLKGRTATLKPIVESTMKALPKATIVSVFGNEEYDEVKDKLRAEYPEITWLDDDYVVVDLEGRRAAIVGTRGSLDRPTAWQRRNIPGIAQLYRARERKIADLIRKVKSSSDIVVLVSHYAVTYKTLVGEPRWAWPEMASRGMEKVVATSKPDVVIHGHAHNSKVCKTEVAGVPVYNVAIPATKTISLIEVVARETPRKASSLLRFFEQ